ncbi:cation:proton antiporter [Phenylobacterium immobile]|uniref:cation:proton antiporter n=1 Tax=Phenylobacterium immobile TaxID=21 RepID=UPI000ADD13A8|nr:sodium:proton antiporter [Phenylobacterium immobile]
MDATHLFELGVAMFVAIIALHFAARKLGLPPSVALLAGGGALAFVPGAPAIAVNPDLVLVIFLPPLLLDGAWTIPVARLRRHMVGIASLAVGSVFFTCAVVAVVAHMLVPSLPWAACAALGAVVAPPDAIAARAALARVKLPGRLRVLLEGESLLNDASGLVLFRFAVAAAATGTFSAVEAGGGFVALSLGGAVVGALVGLSWTKLVRRLGDEYLIIAATALMSWVAYLAGEMAHVSGVIAVVTAGLIASWNQHTVWSASTRIRGTAFWTVLVFLLEAAVFVLIGLSLRDVVDRGGGFGVVAATMGWPILAVLAALVAARFVWVFGWEVVVRGAKAAGWRGARPMSWGAASVISWAGARGVVTLALALSTPAGFPGRDLILVTAFAVIVGTVLGQGTTLGRVVGWARLREPEAEKPAMSMSEAEAAMAEMQVRTVEALAYDKAGALIHPQLLERYQRRAKASIDYAAETEAHRPRLEAHFDVVLAAVAAGRAELVRLHRAGEIDDETLDELERDLDLEELGAISATA